MMRLSRRQFSQGLCAGALAAAMPFAGGAAMAETMTARARRLLGALTDAQREDALLAFQSEARRDWHFFPRSRPGVTVGGMAAPAWAALREFLATLFSAQGMEKVDGVIRLEKVLHDLSFFSLFRDPGNYAVVFFGEPDAARAWGWRFEGHHLSVSATVVADLGVAATPAFFGANPQTVPAKHEHAGLRVLAAEEDLAFQLVRGLDGAARARAVIAAEVPENIVAGPGREQSINTITGLPVAAMTGAARGLVEKLLDAYLGNMTAEIAARETARVRDAGWQALHFGWSGATEPGKPHYYRLHGPSVLIEYDNSRSGADHVHSVWHNPTDLFGADMLKRHYAAGGH